MCNLYTVRKSAAEVAAHFGVDVPDFADFNVPDEVYPGYPGMVVREVEGRRVLQSMSWGFPVTLKSMKPGSKPMAVNNIADLTRPTWKPVAMRPEGRCLIPVTEFAEAEGQKGRMTRTWISVKEQPIFAWAGLWRPSVEWGDVYSGYMTDCNEVIRPVHDRMPVLLHESEYEQWLHGSFDDLQAFGARCFPDDLIEMRRTDELWYKPREKPSAQASLF